MFLYSAHERCASPHVRLLSRKHRSRTRRRVGRSRRGAAPRGCVGHPFPLRAGPHVPIPTCPEQCVGMRVWVCVCVQVGVLRMTSTVRAAGQRSAQLLRVL